MTESTTVPNNFEVALEPNDIVQVQSNVSDLEHVGLLGYVKSVSDKVVTVSFYYAKEKGENAYVLDVEFLRAELYFVGRPNPELLPC